MDAHSSFEWIKLAALLVIILQLYLFHLPTPDLHLLSGSPHLSSFFFVVQSCCRSFSQRLFTYYLTFPGILYSTLGVHISLSPWHKATFYIQDSTESLLIILVSVSVTVLVCASWCIHSVRSLTHLELPFTSLSHSFICCHSVTVEMSY